jgi:polysaccharide export outer membrane protein
MKFRVILTILAAGWLLASFTSPAAAQGAPAAVMSAQDYKLGVTDKVRVVVYNEATLSGEYAVAANGAIAYPLIGDVPAIGRTTTELAREIETRLADGLLRDPKVSIDVVNFRPFYILGEVNKPGEYPYAVGLSVLNAVATAQGFTYRADKRRVFIRSAGQDGEAPQPLDAGTMVKPGDTIRIGERFF